MFINQTWFLQDCAAQTHPSGDGLSGDRFAFSLIWKSPLSLPRDVDDWTPGTVLRDWVWGANLLPSDVVRAAAQASSLSFTSWYAVPELLQLHFRTQEGRASEGIDQQQAGGRAWARGAWVEVKLRPPGPFLSQVEGDASVFSALQHCPLTTTQSPLDRPGGSRCRDREHFPQILTLPRWTPTSTLKGPLASHPFPPGPVCPSVWMDEWMDAGRQVLRYFQAACALLLGQHRPAAPGAHQVCPSRPAGPGLPLPRSARPRLLPDGPPWTWNHSAWFLILFRFPFSVGQKLNPLGLLKIVFWKRMRIAEPTPWVLRVRRVLRKLGGERGICRGNRTSAAPGALKPPPHPAPRWLVCNHCAGKKSG